jgi:hypothetical protein
MPKACVFHAISLTMLLGFVILLATRTSMTMRNLRAGWGGSFVLRTWRRKSHRSWHLYRLFKYLYHSHNGFWWKHLLYKKYILTILHRKTFLRPLLEIGDHGHYGVHSNQQRLAIRNQCSACSSIMACPIYSESFVATDSRACHADECFLIKYATAPENPLITATSWRSLEHER